MREVECYATLTICYNSHMKFLKGRMMGMENIILDRIAFGGVKELEEIYSE